jgi:MoaA/NifB/PqqE/SkfB family radical SAM enzyme
MFGHSSKTEMLNGLDFLWLEITGKCNLTCTHCYAESGPSVALQGDMTIRDWKRVIDEAAELGCRQTQFIGGEPTLHPELETMIGHAHAQGFRFIEVFTNATRLSDPLINSFKKYGVHVAVSFYSDVMETHDKITRNVGSWGRTVSGLRAIIAANLPLRVGFIEMAENTGEVDRSREFLRSMGVTNISSDRLRGIGRGDRVPRVVDGEHFEELCGKCGQGKLCITSSGAVFPCVFSRATRVGDAKGSLASILESSGLRAFRERMFATNVADCNPDCTPYCNPNCSPDCMPHCNPNCNPDCSPNCNPNCNPDRRW